MYTLYRLNADDLDDGFLQSLKELFKGQTIEIAVSEAEDASEDETAYLLQNPENRQRLLQALENARRGDLVTVEYGRDPRLSVSLLVSRLSCSTASAPGELIRDDGVKARRRR